MALNRLTFSPLLRLLPHLGAYFFMAKPSKIVVAPIYVNDLFGSMRVDAMEADEFGAYMALLLRMYQHGGSLPNDDRILQKLSKMSHQKWRQTRSKLLANFDLTPSGELTHHRVQAELQRISKTQSVNAERAKKGADARWSSNASSMLQASDKQCSEMPIHIPSHIHIQNSIDSGKPLSPSPDGDGMPADGAAKPKPAVERPKKEGELGARDETGFPEFWAKYPRKEGKAPALKAWLKIRNIDTRRAAYNGLLRWLKYWEANGTKRQYIPHAATWLNQSRWSDELTMSNTNTPLTGSNAQGGRFPAQTPSVLPVAKGMTPGGVVIT